MINTHTSEFQAFKQADRAIVYVPNRESLWEVLRTETWETYYLEALYLDDLKNQMYESGKWKIITSQIECLNKDFVPKNVLVFKVQNHNFIRCIEN